LARRGQRQSGNTRNQGNQRSGRRHGDNEGIIPVLARAVREVEARAQRGPVSPSARTKFQVVALLVREERARIKADTELTEAKKADQLKRLDGVATILAKTAASDTTLLSLLAEDATVSDAAKELRREMITSAGMELEEEEEPEPDAFPLLAVVPNVVKRNWAHEAGMWVPNRTVTVIHGDGDDVDGFADIVVVNYEILDRHVGWLGEFGFRTMVVDEAHFIKNKQSQRSQNVLHLSDRIRARTARPLLLALTGTPLINDIEDFHAIWEFLGWIDDKKPLAKLMDKLEETGLTPADPGFYPAARNSVVEMGIVRRRKVDVAADIPARRIADLPVELDDEIGRSIREAERELARRLLERYDMAIATRRTGTVVDGIDHELVRRVATWEREDTTTTTKDGDNVFTMLRRIGQAKAGLAADYAAQLARNVGKVVFFAKHVDVMDLAGETFERRGIRYSEIRGDQTPKAREENIRAFQEDPEVQIIICSLMAAGVGINLQISSNVVLAELSWTDAEQTQAIDRVHRIGQAEPVTAWRIIASQTIDTKIAELIDSKAGIAARALDGSDEEVGSSVDIQLEALVALLTEALEERERTGTLG
jgi:SNF2 family DNA or RNA helicase